MSPPTPPGFVSLTCLIVQIATKRPSLKLGSRSGHNKRFRNARNGVGDRLPRSDSHKRYVARGHLRGSVEVEAVERRVCSWIRHGHEALAKRAPAIDAKLSQHRACLQVRPHKLRDLMTKHAHNLGVGGLRLIPVPELGYGVRDQLRHANRASASEKHSEYERFQTFFADCWPIVLPRPVPSVAALSEAITTPSLHLMPTSSVTNVSC